MTRSLVLEVLSVKTIKFMLVSFVFFVLFAVAMPAPARAAALTESQIQSMLSLLKSFNADQGVIDGVGQLLREGVPVPDVVLKVPVVTLSAEPSYVAPTERAQLVWSSKNATSCVLETDGVAESVHLQGTRTVMPQETSTYELTCVNQSSSSEKKELSASKKVTINVGRVPAPTCRLIANKDRVEKGQKVTLTWVSSNADYASKKGGGYGPAQGSVAVEPKESMTYVKTVYGKGGSAKCTADVKVVDSPVKDRQEIVFNSGNIASQIVAAVVSAPAHFIAQLASSDENEQEDHGQEREREKEARFRALKARNMASSTNQLPKEMPQGLDKNKFPGASACGFLMRNLKRGMSGDDVKQLQEYLRSTGDLQDEASGIFGAKTEDALKKIQQRQQIIASGTPETTGFGAAGPRTRMLLMAQCKALKERRDNGSATSTKPVSVGDRKAPPTCTLIANKTEVQSGEAVTISWSGKHASYASMPNGERGPVHGSIEVTPTETTSYVKRVYGEGGEGSCSISVAVVGDTSQPEEKLVERSVSEQVAAVVEHTSALDKVFDNAGQVLASAITAYLGLFNIKL